MKVSQLIKLCKAVENQDAEVQIAEFGKNARVIGFEMIEDNVVFLATVPLEDTDTEDTEDLD